MNNFRIVQTQLLTEALPYEIEELIRVWYLPWLVWRPLREQFVLPLTFRPAIRRFQTPREVNLYLDLLVVARGRQQAEQVLRLDEVRQMQQLPYVVAELKIPVLS
jgi:hypothetical protein